MSDTCAIELPKNGLKDKLRDWYIDKIANNGETFDKVDNISASVISTAGGVALHLIAPVLTPLIPAIQKGYRVVSKFLYNTGKKIIHKGLNIEEEDLDVKDAPKIIEEISESPAVEELTTIATNAVIEERSKGARR